MDTRGKIRDLAAVEEAARAWRRAGGTVLVATGYFGLLDAATAGELARMKACQGRALLVAALLESPKMALDARARAEMTAALGMVDYVVIAGDGMPVERLLATLQPHAVARYETAHQQRMRQFIDHVHQRHSNGQ